MDNDNRRADLPPCCRCGSPVASHGGYDAADPMSRDVPVPDYRKALQASTRRMRLGIPRALHTEHLD
jgi:hypothetical protein